MTGRFIFGLWASPSVPTIILSFCLTGRRLLCLCESDSFMILLRTELSALARLAVPLITAQLAYVAMVFTDLSLIHI